MGEGLFSLQFRELSQSSVSLRMTSQTKASPFLQKKKDLEAGEQPMWASPIQVCVGLGPPSWPLPPACPRKVQCPPSVHMSTHIPSHRLVLEPWVRIHSALQG